LKIKKFQGEAKQEKTTGIFSAYVPRGRGGVGCSEGERGGVS